MNIYSLCRFFSYLLIDLGENDRIFVRCFQNVKTMGFRMETRNKTYILLTLSIVWSILIFVLCTIPQNSLPKIKILHIDKVAHFGFFFVQSVLLSLLLRFRTNRSFFQIILLSTWQAFIYGGIIEIVQNEFFNRTSELYDLIADTLGGFCGAITCAVLFSVWAKKHTTEGNSSQQ